MKKIVTVFLILVLVLSLSLSAFAAYTQSPESGDGGGGDVIGGKDRPGGPNSPATGEPSVNLFLVGTIVFGVAAAAFAGSAAYTGRKQTAK